MKKNLIFVLSALTLLISCNTNSSSTNTSTSSENTTISPTTSTTTSLEEKFTFNNLNENVELTDLPTNAKENDSITFGYIIKNGYVLNTKKDVEVTFNNGKLPLNDNNDGTFTFIMPKGNVDINVPTSNGLFLISLNDENSLISSIKCQYSTFYTSTEQDTFLDISTQNNKAEFNKKVIVKLTNSSKLKPTGLIVKAKEETTLELVNNEATFIMPSQNITIIPIFEDNTHNVIFNNSQHLTMSLFKKENDKYIEVTKVISDQELYLKVNKQANFDVLTLNYKYTPTYTSEKEINLLPLLQNDGYYKFTLDTLKDNTDVVFNITEKEVGTFDGYTFVDRYFFTTYDSPSSNLNTPKFTIDDSGTFKCNDKNYQIKSATGKTSGTIICTDSNNKEFTIYYNEKCMISFDMFSNSIFFAFKFENESIEYAMDEYKVEGEYIYYDKDNTSKGAIVIIEVNKKSTNDNYARVFVDTSNKKYYLDDVSFEFTSTKTNFTNQDSSYKLKVNNITYAEIEGTSKYSPKHVILDKVKGEYHLSSSNEITLILDGKGNATYEGETFKYTINDNEITLTNGTRTDVITIDLINKTYIVKSSETIADPYIGKTYSGQNLIYTYEFYDEYFTVYCTIDIKFIDKQTCEITWEESEDNDPSNPYETNATYTIKEKLVTISLKRKNYSTETTTLQFNDDYSILTFKSHSDPDRNGLAGDKLTAK